MRPAPVALSIAFLLAFGGCLANPRPATDDANAGAAPSVAGHVCGPGEVVVGFDAFGVPTCKSLSAVAQDAAALAAAQQATTPSAPSEVASNLRVAGVYGVRNDSAHDLDRIIAQVELSAGAAPMDLTKLVLRYSDGAHVQTYAYGGPTGFSPSWVRGANDSGVMSSGDLVAIQFELDQALPPRTPVQLSLIPETGTPVAADFKTPSTYGTDTTITLR